jgi:cytochrome c oxidase assembly protein subunit 11
MERPMRPLLIKLVSIPVLMFGFGYMMVPIYNVFCEVTGLNGKTGSMTAEAASQLKVDRSRLIKVQFVASVNENGPWGFHPVEKSMMVHPGQRHTITYYAHNLLDEPLVSQSIPSIAPFKAASYFKKTQCFCFNEQKFNAKEQREMPVTFVINPDLPKDVDTIVLSYTLFTKTKT